METITLEQFRNSINWACDRAGVSATDRQELLYLGPGVYALGAYIRGGLDCPVEATFHRHRGPIRDGNLDGYYGTPLSEFAHHFDQLHRGQTLTVVP